MLRCLVRRASLVTLLMLVQCGARTDLGGARGADASTDSCTSTPSTTCAQPVCTGGTCVAEVSDGGANSFALDETRVFWTSTHALMRADKCGANATVLIGCVDGMYIRAEDEENLYVVTTVSGEPLRETVSRLSKNGGNPVELASFDALVSAVAIQGDELFLSVAPESSPEGRLVKMPAAGGAQTTLFTGRIEHGLAVDGHEIFFGSGVYLMRIDDDGTALSTLADTTLPGDVARAQAIVLDSSFAYTTSGCGDVQRAARDGSSAKAELLGMVSQAYGATCHGIGEGALALDDAFVYLAYGGNDATAPSIVRVSKAGGALDTVIAPGGKPFAVARDPSGIFWIDGTSLSVLTGH